MKIEIKQQNRASINFKKIMQKAIKPKAQIYLKFNALNLKYKLCFLKNHYPAYITTLKMQI